MNQLAEGRCIQLAGLLIGLTISVPSVRHLTARDLRLAIAEGRVSPRDAAIELIEAIGQEDPELHAWLKVKSQVEAPLGESSDISRSPLFGIPIGIKDNIDTAEFGTEYGSEIYHTHQPVHDAACVNRLRESGAIILGKTALAEFAVRRPCATRNPSNRSHTPGGSSSGSAAAVAANLAPICVGTQTGGSVIRPASYCGVAAIKPTYGIVSRAGIKTLSDSVDTIGFFARSLEDLALVLGAVARDRRLVRLAIDGFESSEDIRLAFCKISNGVNVSEEMKALFTKVQSVAVSKYNSIALDLDTVLEGADAASDVVTEFETWQSLGSERTHFGELCSPQLVEVLSRGERHSFDEYVAARQKLEAARLTLDDIFSGVDCLVTPSVPGPAPYGLDDTGPSTFNKAWTALQFPCVNVPAGADPEGLPLGLQIISGRHRDERALRGARKLQTIIQEVV